MTTTPAPHVATQRDGEPGYQPTGVGERRQWLLFIGKCRVVVRQFGLLPWSADNQTISESR